MQLIIKLQVDSKLDRELTKHHIYNAIHSWLSENESCIPIAQDHDYEDEKLIRVDEIVVN